MILRNEVMNTIKGIFENFGYSYIETPILNPAETILGKYGTEGDQLTYTWMDRGERQIALPYDLTVPFARYVAANWRELPMPFKRYQIQRVWRAEKPQKGRLREFYQCDIDIIGTKSLLVEAEVAKIITLVFDKLKINDIKIKFNSRKILNEVLTRFGVEKEKAIDVIRIIDKLDKIGNDEVVNELKDIGVSDSKNLMKILSPEKDLVNTLNKFKDYNISEVSEFLKYCEDLGVDEKNLKFDPTLARGLDYYTGLIFEVVSESSDFGTICAGGRYDNLCAMFSDQDFSGMGVAFGFERIMLIVKEMQKERIATATSKALVTIFKDETKEDSLLIYKLLINGGIASEIYFQADKLGKQIAFADKKKIPFVIIQGPNEKEKNEVVIKRLDSGIEKNISLNQLTVYIKNFYELDN